MQINLGGIVCWKTRSQFLLIVYIILQQQQNVATYSDRIIFPDDPVIDTCQLDNIPGAKGVCKKLIDCPGVLNLWKTFNIAPQRCYFMNFDEFVCCPMADKPKLTTNKPKLTTEKPKLTANLQQQKKRISQIECEKAYGPRIAVVHGEPTVPREFPYMVALGWNSQILRKISFLCGGVLVSERYVLTAAHCVDLNGEMPTVSRLGGVNLTDTTVKNIKINKVIKHPDYNVQSAYNDIALIELAETVKETPACVWSQPTLPHDDVTTIGYGHTRFGGQGSTQLLKASLQLVNNQECARYYKPDVEYLRKGIIETQICAKDPENLRDSCQGDSGGPIMLRAETYDGTFPYVVGITSLGQGCAGDPPSVYTRVSTFVDWIESIVWPTTSNLAVVNIRNNANQTPKPQFIKHKEFSNLFLNKAV